MESQTASTTSREKTRQFQTRSTFEMNFIAAASSRKPIVTLTEFSHPPLLGSAVRNLGTRARKKNGAAKTSENPSIPRAGQSQSPCEVATRTVPTKGTVHVKLVNVNVRPMSTVCRYPPVSPALESLVRTLEGMLIWYSPKRLRANPTKIDVIVRFTQGFAANWLIPV